MLQLSSVDRYTAGPAPLLRPVSAAATESDPEPYIPLLLIIAQGFGFTESEGHGLVAQVRAYARTHPPADCYPFRIWLAKIMVHTCTFRISNRLFAQCGCSEQQGKDAFPEGYCSTGNADRQRIQDMPLSFRAVYILSQAVGFTKSEIALILNTTPAQVVQRYTRALAFLAGQKRAI